MKQRPFGPEPRASVRSAAVAHFPLGSFGKTAMALACLSLVGCERTMPPLVDVFEIGPRSIERHERLEIRGAGFPPGRSASVSFRGVVNAPGERPAAVDIVADGKVVSDDAVAVPFDEALESRFAGRGGTLRHATFHGLVEVRFAVPGGVPVHGARDDLELDVRPKLRLDADGEERGRAVLAKLGVAPAEDDLLVLGELVPGGVAEQHGLLSGDRIVAFAGVRVHGAGDLSDQNVPRPLTLRYLREGESSERIVSIDAPPFARAVPAWLGFALLGFAAFALTAALLVSRRLTRVRRWEIALGAMLREQAAASSRPKTKRSLRHVAQWAPPVALTLALAVSPLVPAWAELDVPTLFVAWLAARIVLTRPRGSSTKRVRRVLGWTTEALASVLPLSAVVVLGVHVTASLRVNDISAAQGTWRWLAVQTPWMTLAAVVMLATSCQTRVDRPTALHRLADVLGAALLVLVALGGWQPMQGGASASWLMPLAFVCKIILVRAASSGVAAWSDRASGTARDSQAGFTGSFVALAAVAGHFALGMPGWLAEFLAPGLLLLLAVATLTMLVRALGMPPGLADELDPA